MRPLFLNLFLFFDYIFIYFSKISFVLFGGAKRDRTADLLRAKQALSQLSYSPMVGLNGLEPSTSRLSGVRSNQLSYRPSTTKNIFEKLLVSQNYI